MTAPLVELVLEELPLEEELDELLLEELLDVEELVLEPEELLAPAVVALI
jgi:hypothetical protein